MIDLVGRVLSGAALAVLALLGMAMALVFTLATAVVVGALYLVARLRGKPFGIRAHWHQRSQAYRFGAAPFASGHPVKPRAGDVIDVSVRDVN